MEQNKQLLERYASLKAEASIIDDKIEEIKEKIIEIVEESNPVDHEIQTDFGVFSVVQKRKYTYSPEILSKEEEIKQAKKEEEAKGTAPYVIQPYLKFINVSNKTIEI